MSDIIQLLPDSVANQIAAGEVVQRPASVIKELVENAIDAGSSDIKIILKDAGRTSIQIIDNGCGMSETDARLSFERHATSKIRKAEDLFCIHTKGFRGEALASIAAIADVELKTKRHENELGTYINIKGSEVLSQEPVSCPNGTNFLIKNLFFNVPARRKFLKTNATELKHIINEFQRIALAHTEINFTLSHNDSELYNLPEGNLRQRIVNIFGRPMNQNLIDLKTETTIVNLKGFIGKPEYAKKSYGEQFFFVNNRFMKHPYFHKALMSAYDKLLGTTIPSYFIFLDVDPSSIDINIHPTKTEIKFEDEFAIFQIIQAATKEALGKFNIVPSIDFNTEGLIDIPVPQKDDYARLPEVEINKNFNPFEEEKSMSSQGFSGGGSSSGSKSFSGFTPNTEFSSGSSFKKEVDPDWQKLYSGLEKDNNVVVHQTSIEPEESELFQDQTESFARQIFQFKNKYILSPVKSGLMVIHQQRAHERILYEKFINSIKAEQSITQQNLFPNEMEMSPEDYSVISAVLDDLQKVGFDIESNGNNTIVIKGIPGFLDDIEPEEIINDFIEAGKSETFDVKNLAREQITSTLAKSASIKTGKKLSGFEMQQIVDELFACSSPNYSPDNKLIISIMNTDQIDKLFN